LTETELEAWSQQPGHRVLTFRVTDNFGDSGLTGLASLEVRDGVAHVVDFLLSCRVLGRRVEETMVACLVAEARMAGAAEVWAAYVPTAKNRPVLDFWHRSGFRSSDGAVFSCSVTEGYPQPRCVKVVHEVANEQHQTQWQGAAPAKPSPQREPSL
jgi:predicted enzyme involved in methoxymalonyl-ACP biosynthesis